MELGRVECEQPSLSFRKTPLVRKLSSQFTLFMLMATSTTEAQLPAIDEDAIVSQVSRTTIMVRDLDESLKLYRDILGFKPRWDSMLEGS